MSDYFFDACDARAQLAGSTVVIKNLIKCLTEMEGNVIFRDVSIQCAEDQLKEIEKILKTTMGDR